MSVAVPMSAPKKQCLFAPCGGKAEWMKSIAIQKIISCSKSKGDSYHEVLQQLNKSGGGDKDVTVWCHKGCYCSYTSESRNVSKTRKAPKRSASHPLVCDRLLKSQVSTFSREDFKTKCFLCAAECQSKDPKHPDRWRRWVQCEKEPLDENAPTFKDTLLDICDQRQDDWSKEVFLRLQAVMTTLPAYDGRYHLDCFYAFRRISKDSRNAETSRLLIDASLKCVVDLLKETSSTLPTYTLSELHDCYMKASGYLSKKQMLNNLSQYFGEELVVLHVPGCETEIGLHKNVGRTLKLSENTCVKRMMR